MKFFSAIMTAVIIIGITGCEKDKTEEAPDLPPISSMVINFDSFNTTKTTGSYVNIGKAVTHVLYWNTMLTLQFAIPVAAYTEAMEQEAERIDNDTWQWSYNVEIEQTTYAILLTADVTGEIVDWEMKVSQEGGFQDFVWYTGSSNVTATTGNWTLFQNPADPSALIEITWNHDYEAETFDVKYENVSGDDYDGSYIYYAITEDPVFNANYEIYNAFSGSSVLVNLNTVTHVGNITVGQTIYCWDENYLDVECIV